MTSRTDYRKVNKSLRYWKFLVIGLVVGLPLAFFGALGGWAGTEYHTQWLQIGGFELGPYSIAEVWTSPTNTSPKSIYERDGRAISMGFLRIEAWGPWRKTGGEPTE